MRIWTSEDSRKIHFSVLLLGFPRVRKLSRPSGKHPDYLEAFRLSGNFPGYLETIWIIRKIFRLSVNFPGYPEKVSVSKIFGLKKVSVSVSKYLVSKKVSILVSKMFGLKKSLGIGFK